MTIETKNTTTNTAINRTNAHLFAFVSGHYLAYFLSPYLASQAAWVFLRFSIFLAFFSW